MFNKDESITTNDDGFRRNKGIELVQLFDLRASDILIFTGKIAEQYDVGDC